MQAFVSMNCVGCHAPNGGGGMGPALSERTFIYGREPANIYLSIVGSKSGAVPNYSFSPALRAADITWDEQTLDKFLANPMADVRGTKMPIRVANPAERQNVIAYLEILKP
jgi:cytochrome c2